MIASSIDMSSLISHFILKKLDLMFVQKKAKWSEYSSYSMWCYSFYLLLLDFITEILHDVDSNYMKQCNNQNKKNLLFFQSG